MKKLLPICLVILFTTLFSNTTYAQRDAGGSSDGSCITQPTPVSFKRNNGEGTCGNNAEIRLKFNQSPTEAPVLIGLMYDDGTTVSNVLLPVTGNLSELAHKGYITYCLMGGNISPAKKLIAIFHYPGGCQDDTILYE